MELPIEVSICCLTYNHEKYIEEAVNSFLMQKTSFRFEIIIFDDCSTDSTTEIINRIKSKNPELIKIIRPQQNTFSQGKTSFYDLILASKGKYIACCEGDDYWVSENKLQDQFDFLENNPNIDVCFHPSYTLIGKDILDYKYGYNGNKPSIIPTKEVIKSSSGYIPMPSMMIRSSEFKKIFHSYPDFFSTNLWHSTIQIIGSIRGGAGYIPDYYSVYRSMHPGSWSKSNAENTQIRVKNFKSFVYRNRKLKNIVSNSVVNWFDYPLIRRTLSFTIKEKLDYKEKVRILKSAFFEKDSKD